MKILLISNMYPSAAKPYAGVFVKNHFEALKELFRNSEDSVELFTMKRTFTSKLGSLGKYLLAFFRFAPYLTRRYDLLHVHYFFPIFLTAYLYKICHPRTKVVVTFHGRDVLKFNRLLQVVYGRLGRKADFIISVGHDLSLKLARHLGMAPHAEISAGVDQRVFYPLDGCAKEYDLLFVGSFVERKGIDLLLEAIRRVEDPNLRYCFVGSGSHRDAILDLGRERNVTMFENQTQSELRLLYNKAKFFILPSRHEPFGLVVTEALYCGTPAIVSTTGGLVEQVRDGENGYIIPENNPDEIAGVIRKAAALTGAEYQQLAARARQSNAQFSLAQVVEEQADIYRRLVTPRSIP